jgi:hypothetical protein
MNPIIYQGHTYDAIPYTTQARIWARALRVTVGVERAVRILQILLVWHDCKITANFCRDLRNAVREVESV